MRIGILGDTVHEANEAFTVRLSAAAGATIARDTATGTILDNDAVVPPPATSHAGFFHTQGNQIVDAAGQPVRIAGVNWFGFETSNFAPHGLWARSYKDMMDQMKQLGFNTIRLPFSDQLLRRRQHAQRHRLLQEPRPAGPERPADHGQDRRLRRPDRPADHPRPPPLRRRRRHRRQRASGTPAAYPESRWIADWRCWRSATPATRRSSAPTCTTSRTARPPGATATANDWRLAAERAGNAILARQPELADLRRGHRARTRARATGGAATCRAPGPSRSQLNVPNQLVYSPHDYPASVYPQTWFSDPNYPNNLPAVWDQNWGYLYRQDIAPGPARRVRHQAAATPRTQPWLDKHDRLPRRRPQRRRRRRHRRPASRA